MKENIDTVKSGYEYVLKGKKKHHYNREYSKPLNNTCYIEGNHSILFIIPLHIKEMHNQIIT